jgi:hypothetical protein
VRRPVDLRNKILTESEYRGTDILLPEGTVTIGLTIDALSDTSFEDLSDTAIRAQTDTSDTVYDTRELTRVEGYGQYMSMAAIHAEHELKTDESGAPPKNITLIYGPESSEQPGEMRIPVAATVHGTLYPDQLKKLRELLPEGVPIMDAHTNTLLDEVGVEERESNYSHTITDRQLGAATLRFIELFEASVYNPANFSRNRFSSDRFFEQGRRDFYRSFNKSVGDMNERLYADSQTVNNHYGGAFADRDQSFGGRTPHYDSPNESTEPTPEESASDGSAEAKRDQDAAYASYAENIQATSAREKRERDAVPESKEVREHAERMKAKAEAEAKAREAAARAQEYREASLKAAAERAQNLAQEGKDDIKIIDTAAQEKFGRPLDELDDNEKKILRKVTLRKYHPDSEDANEDIYNAVDRWSR